MESPAPVIRLDAVTMRYTVPKRYRDLLLRPLARGKRFTALRGVNLHVARGECLGVLGPNGAGKTTLLRLIGGLLYPTEGTITIGGFDTRSENLQARQQAAFALNEERSFYWRLTGQQNLEFFGALDNIPPGTLRKEGKLLMKRTGLNGVAYKRVSDYSSGMRQRLALARALLAEPEVLLLDEPTRSLDPLAALSLMRSIRDELQAAGGKTLVLVTHTLDEIEELCQRVCVVVEGRVSAVGEVREIVGRPGGLPGFYRKAVADDE